MVNRDPAAGVVACGHKITAATAERVLLEGGNAFDAVVAAHFAACASEPVLASLGGGGYLLARKSSGEIIGKLTSMHERHELWQGQNLFFGGVHSVLNQNGIFSATGDPRRGGEAIVVKKPS